MKADTYPVGYSAGYFVVMILIAAGLPSPTFRKAPQAETNQKNSGNPF